jgi:hypothetical protein
MNAQCSIINYWQATVVGGPSSLSLEPLCEPLA